MKKMKIESSVFADFTTSGAVNIDVGKVNIGILDSCFTGCFNSLSGGAVRVVYVSGDCKFNRLCGKNCHTTTPRNAMDYGQFVFVNCSEGEVKYENLVSCFCTERKYTEMHNGPLGFIGSAKFRSTHSNSSCNHCQIGPGLVTKASIDATVSYMNFANDSAYSSSSMHWIAVVFYEGVGSVSFSNFYECSSIISKCEKPTGTYKGCAFTRCIGYDISLLSSDNQVQDPLDFYFPQTCIAKLHCSRSEQPSKNKIAICVLIGLN